MGASETRTEAVGTPTTKNVASITDYKPYDFTSSDAAKRNKESLANTLSKFQYDANWYAPLEQSAMQAAGQQAIANVRGVGNTYGQLGGAHSGAAAAAAAAGALAPIYQAQTQVGLQKAQAQQQISMMRNQAELEGNQRIYDTYTGIIAPSYQSSPQNTTATTGTKGSF